MAFINPDPWTADRVIKEATLDLNRFLEKHLDEARRVPTVRKKVVLGEVDQRIVEVADVEKADLIVMSPRPPWNYEAILLGKRHRQGHTRGALSGSFGLSTAAFASMEGKANPFRVAPSAP